MLVFGVVDFIVEVLIWFFGFFTCFFFTISTVISSLSVIVFFMGFWWWIWCLAASFVLPVGNSEASHSRFYFPGFFLVFFFYLIFYIFFRGWGLEIMCVCVSVCSPSYGALIYPPPHCHWGPHDGVFFSAPRLLYESPTWLFPNIELIDMIDRVRAVKYGVKLSMQRYVDSHESRTKLLPRAKSDISATLVTFLNKITTINRFDMNYWTMRSYPIGGFPNALR